jgi:hypothetical protein
LWIVSWNAVAWIWPNAGALLHLSWKLRNEITALVFAGGAGTRNRTRQTVEMNSGVLRRQNESAEWRTQMAQAERVGALEHYYRRGWGTFGSIGRPRLCRIGFRDRFTCRTLKRVPSTGERFRP